MGPFALRPLLALAAALLLAVSPALAAEEELELSAPQADSVIPVPAPAVESPAAAPSDSAQPAPAAEIAIDGPAVDGPAEDGLTIEVDQSQSKNEGKSLPLALLYSALLPGGGELYLDEKPKAKTFLLTEAGFWASLYVAWIAKASYLESARNHASEHAGIDASGKDEDFLETMAVYRVYQEKQHRQDSYELAQVLSGKREQDYDIKPLPENYWDFGTSANPGNTRAWKDFQGTMRYYRASKVAMSFALGALALNRMASLVNTLQTYKRTSTKRIGWDITPDLGPDYAGSRLVLTF